MALAAQPRTLDPRVLADVVPVAWVRNIVLVVGAAAFVAVCAQITFYLPWNPLVPLTLQTFAVVLSAGALGTWRAGAAMALYAVVGSLGAPIFMDGLSGFGGPAYGYIPGFIIAALVVGRIAESGATKTFWRSVGLMVIGNLIIYVVGTTWLKYSLGVPWFGPESAWAYGVKDFLVGDVLKILAAAGLLPLAWAGLRKAGLTSGR
jgi:biotin transport system substrate-specific component